MSDLPKWHPGAEFDGGAEEWQREPDLCKALEAAAAEHYYAEYCGYHRLMLAAKEEIERLQNELHEINSSAKDHKFS